MQTTRSKDRPSPRFANASVTLRRLGGGTLVLFATLLVLVIVFVVLVGRAKPSAPGREVPLNVLIADAEGQRIARATLLDQDGRVAGVRKPSGERVWAAYPTSDAATQNLIDVLRKGGAEITVDQQPGKRQAAFLAQFVLPLLLLANLFGLLFTIGRSGGARDLLLFSRLRKGGAAAGAERRTTFNDVAGAKHAVIELQEVVQFLGAPERFAAMGAIPPKGVLLVGPPGCGKTLIARAVAGEAGVPFLSISGSEFVESLVGVGAARVRDLFRQAAGQAPSIVFIDELDAAGRRRGAGVGGGHDEREQTLNELLVQMDGFSGAEGVVVIGATNRPDILDPALLRPGRFDRKVTIDLPDVEGREQILAIHARGKKLGGDVTLADVARRTPGFSGADLANVLNEAALLAVRADRSAISPEDTTEAIDRVLAGPRQRTHRLTPDELRRIAVHEAGHALVAAACRGPETVPKVTIISRGRHVGHLEVLQRDDRVVIGRADLLDELAVAMAGVAAEELIFSEPSTAGEGDLERATELARRIVARYGMTDAVGRIQVLEKEEEVFLGRDYLATKRISPAVLEEVDEEVRRLLDEAEKRAESHLRARPRSLESLAAALHEREVLEGDELATLLESSLAAKSTGTARRGDGLRARPRRTTPSR
jgi:cell division protease FtsH